MKHFSYGASKKMSCLAFLLLISPFISLAQNPHDTSHKHHKPGSAGDPGKRMVEVISVDGQPLAANVDRLVEALEYLGAPLRKEIRKELSSACRLRDAKKIQALLDPSVLLVVDINPEARVKVARGPAQGTLQQAGYTPVVVKVVNESSGTQRLRIGSPQAGPVYAGVAELSMERQHQEHLRKNENTEGRTDRFLDLEMFEGPPMTANLSGLGVEYAIALIYSSEAGQREATLTFDVGQGTQDLGFRGEVPVLFDVNPAIAVRLNVQDHDGTETTGRFQFVDMQGHVFPPQAKRLAPDLFFQKQIYRADGETVLLPPGEFTMYYGRGPEYRWQKDTLSIPHFESGNGTHEISMKLERWINPAAYGFYSGDHHIHASGCAHYTSPTEGVDPADMLRQVKGEGLNIGSVLTWGPGFDHQQHFFAPVANKLSQPFSVIKYDIEVSGFGSQALGHICLLNLREQIYPGAQGSSGWPTWTLPTLRWAKAQGAVAGYAHSGSGLQIEPEAAARRLLDQMDINKDGYLQRTETVHGLLAESLKLTDNNQDGLISLRELTSSHDRVADQLPNFAIPELNSVGAQEIFVTAALGACDFISAMDTERIREWNAWYHLLNCGFPVKASGETDFPCMSGTRVGQGRTYVYLGKQNQLDYAQWCRGIAVGNSYVSDGYAHALEFTVDGKTAGDEIRLSQPQSVTVRGKVAFSPETPLETPYGGIIPVEGLRAVGNTIVLHETQSFDQRYQRGKRLVELVVNGRVVESREVDADGKEHVVEFTVPIGSSSWIALRQFPQMHTNPVNVLVGGKPIRASKKSALWAIGCIDQLWNVRNLRIAKDEREDAEKAYEQAREIYRRIATESAEDK
ncbi:MAG: CehA/McbA family metallohydrolase [Cyclobacteriaceae bacterium]